MAAAFAASLTLQLVFGLSSDDPIGFAYIMLYTVWFTTVVWLVVTFMTAPEPMDKLLSFYRKVHPWTLGWAPVAKLAPEIPPTRDFAYNLLDWICGCVMIYGLLFGIGKIVLEEFGVRSHFPCSGLWRPAL